MIVAEHFGFIVGIDTHAKTHTLAIINTASGGEVANETFPATAAGGTRALSWILRRTGASVETVLLSMEGTGSYGAKLRQQAAEAGFPVTEAPIPNQRLGRYQGKSDSIDAARAARAVLSVSMDRLREPRSGQNHMALRILSNARRSMARERTAAINALTALLRVVDLGLDARKPLTAAQIKTIAAWRERDEEFGIQTCRREATRLAKQILTLQEQMAQNHAELESLVRQVQPALLEIYGIGPVLAAIILTAWSHAGRVRSEAAFAALAGTCPVPASSGGTTRFRLNRGGDRQLNKALYTIALIRMNRDPDTRTYVAKRTSQGRTKKEIIRSLKRYITRQIYRTLNNSGPEPAR
ncbi:IS110 family transposase [Pseudarthrobacter sp. fls2-241-R2A-127]|uniref:IS110 family transposase n=1 Tax=Pseudarthrobacter sp. fls2-241-R2A-127 TaxID=3040303 RepID=UPI002553D6DA|nr:IS110 family transposase [Pseudarthrobacter sp. fls2-241-R2A-127]